MMNLRRLVWLSAGLTCAGLAAAWQVRRARPIGSWFGRVALITGGSRGLGLALARECGAHGAIVWLVARDGDELAQAVEELTKVGIEAHSHVADITDPQQASNAVREVIERHGRLDILINDAGVITAMPFENAELSDFDESLRTHFWGPLYLIRSALPFLRQAAPAHIINVSSIGGRIGVPHLAPYCVGKFALCGLSDTLRAELAPYDVWVTTASPGLMRTGSIRQVKVRGSHEAEARMFAMVGGTRLTTVSAEAAARDIVWAARCGRATVTPNWQARLAHVATTLAPDVSAAVVALVTETILPRSVPAASPSRRIADVDLKWAAPLLSKKLEASYNQH